MRLIFLSMALPALLGATMPETRFAVSLPSSFEDDRSGRLLLFAEPATLANATATEVDTDASDRNGVSVAARDVAGFGATRTVLIDASATAFPRGFATTAKGDYRVQVVLDRNGDYNFGGRGPGDIVSKVVTVRFPLTSAPSIPLDHVMPPESDQFDTTGISPGGAAQIAASRGHLHEEHVVSSALTRFRGAPQSIAAWVLTPPGYDPRARTKYPTVYTANGFGTSHKADGQLLSKIWHLMETHAIPPMIWVSPDYGTPTGTTEFADSVNNGPWGQALVSEMIPTLEARYRMDAKPSGRFLTGHSSGGWFALWVMVRYPALFGGSWPTSPDPSDFRDFLGVDLYSSGGNMYRDAQGGSRPLERDHNKVLTTIETAARVEAVLGHTGGQLQSFDWVFSPRRADGTPAPMFDRESGAVDPVVVAYWRDHYDIGHMIETVWPRLKRDLDGKVHLTVGTADSYYLDGSARRLEAAFRKVGGRAIFSFVPNATHGVNSLYARDGDRAALYKDITKAMYSVARPREKWTAQ
jgi:hypothetical protein